MNIFIFIVVNGELKGAQIGIWIGQKIFLADDSWCVSLSQGVPPAVESKYSIEFEY